MNKSSFRGVLGLLLLACMNVNAELMRDYYSEPGIQEYKGLESQYINESVDAFGGTVQLHFKDAVIPGNGGLDIVVQRSYKSHQRNLMYPQFMGLGWTMHYGRITVPAAHKLKVCEQNLYNATTADNPSLELPDGAAELLMLDHYSPSANRYLITKTNWLVTCRAGGGFDVRSPDGTQYIMDRQFFGETQAVAWYTSKITDRNGNTLTMTYGEEDTPYGKKSFLQQIDASDGRSVIYDYTDGLLSAVRYGGGVVASYTYAPTSGSDAWLSTAYDLIGVSLPDGQDWVYEYYPRAIEPNGDPEPQSNQLKSVTYPTGAKASYEYQKIAFDLNNPYTKTHALSRKVLTSIGVPATTWEYEFIPGAQDQERDKTIIRGPEFDVAYEHYGIAFTRNAGNASWLIGLPAIREVSKSGITYETQYFYYDKKLVSDEDFWHGRNLTGTDNSSFKAIMTGSYLERDGQGVATTNENFDVFGNPQRVIKNRTTTAVEGDLIVDTLYKNDIVNWIIGRPERIEENVGSVRRTTDNVYDVKGNLTRQEVNGVVTSMTYTTAGDLESKTEPGSRTTQYSDYQNGVAQHVVNPDQTTVNRIVDNFGRITSITDENNNTRSFSYDGIGRLTGITYPEGSPVNIIYGAKDKTLTRGGYTEITDTDGWGRVTSVSRNGIRFETRYDGEGRKTFTSYPDSTQGTQYAYDAVGRQKTVTHPDGSVHISHNGSIQTVTDERGNARELLYHNFGSLDGGQLVQVTELGVTGDDPGVYTTTVKLDGFGHPKEVMQGKAGDVGLGRTYDYDNRFYLVTETNPETGITTYTRDAAGNMKSKAIGSLPAIQFDYDERNRLTTITYPDLSGSYSQILTSDNVSYEYDAVGNVTRTVKGAIAREFDYSDNGNLILDRTIVDGVTYDTRYAYTALDHLDSVTYPSGRVINYDSDALGRAARVGSYVASIGYHPSGQVSSMTYANGVETQIALNDRRIISDLHVYGSQGDLLNFHYNYDATQNIVSIADNVDPTKSRSYTYDELNRLITADSSTGLVSYGYNRNDGLIRISNGSGATSLSYVGGVISQRGARNFSKDAMANIVSHALVQDTGSGPQIIDLHEYTYDHSGALRKARKPQAGVSHDWRYDAEGIRVVSEGLNGQNKHFIHNKAGQLLGEYVNGTQTGKETVYLGDQPVLAIKTNEAPSNVSAGVDFAANSGEIVTMASSAIDPEGRPLTYSWQQVSGPSAQISSVDGITRITMPQVPVEEGLVFRLTALDEKGASAYDDVSVTLSPTPADQRPVANPGPAQAVMEGYAFTLDGSASSDVEGPVTFNWQDQTASPMHRLSFDNPALAVQALTAPMVSAEGTATVRLTVTDSAGQTDSKSVQITIKDEGVDSDADGLPDGWEIFFAGNLSLTASGDPDMDGIPTSQEYVERTNPVVAEGVPAQVSGVVAYAGDSAAVVEWSAVKSTSGYSVYWSQTPGFDIASATKVDTQQRSVSITGLVNAKLYYFKVVAKNLIGMSPASIEVSTYVNTRSWATRAALGVGHKLHRKNSRGRWVETVKTNNSLYTLNLYSAGAQLVKSIQLPSYNAGAEIYDISAVVDDLDNIAAIWWEGGYLISATIATSSTSASKENIGCYKNCWKSDGLHTVSNGIRITPDQRGNFAVVWVDDISPSSANDFYKLTAYRLKPGAPSVHFSTFDADITSPSTALYGFYDQHSVRKTSNGKIMIAWAREKTTGKYLRVAEIDLATLSVNQLLDVAVGFNSTTLGKRVGLSVNSNRASVYWEEGTTIYGKDRPFSTGVWGASYALPRAGLATPQSIVDMDASELSENFVYSATKNSTTTYYANSRSLSGTWGAAAIALGLDAKATHAAASGEHIVVGSDANGLAARIRGVNGSWSAVQSVLGGDGVTEVESVTSDNLGNISIIWFGYINGRQISEYKPAAYVPDNLAPETTIATTRRTSKGKVFMDCTLTANEAATTYFRVTGAGTITAGGAASTAWQTYTGMVTVQLTGTATIEYYSVDPSGNTEVTKSEVLQ